MRAEGGRGGGDSRLSPTPQNSTSPCEKTKTDLINCKENPEAEKKLMESIEAYLKEDNSQENESYMVKIPQRINLQNNEELLFIRSDDYGIITCQESEQEEILRNFTIEIRKKVSDKIVDHMLEIEVKVVKTPVKILQKKTSPTFKSKSKLHMKP